MHDLLKIRGARLPGSLMAAAVLMMVPVAVMASTPVGAEEPPTDAVDNLEEQIGVLEDNYLVPAVLESRFRLETRFNEAKVAYLLEDYQRASILFVAVVDSSEVRQFDSYREALYLLGDSLYKQRSFRAGREYFRQVVELGPGPFYQSAIVRLLEIAGEINDYSGVDDLYDRLDDLEQVSAAIHYTRGRTLFDEGRMRSARPWFQRAARDENYAFTARYFEGVALAGAGDYAEADEVFEALTRQVASNSKEAEVLQLTHLARGRLAYERQNYEQAIDHYLQVSRTSDHFTRGLYELTWALVAMGNYRSAMRNLEILLISDPDPRFVPEARALMADLAMRLGEYENARNWFSDLVETFAPVREELQQFIAEHEELDEFFVGLVREELEGLQPDFLPEKVTQWVENDEVMRTSRQLMGDGTMTQEDIDEVYEQIHEIETAIQMGSSIEAFPVLSEGWIQGMELEARMVDIQDQLLDWELQQVQPLMSSSEQQRLAALERDLDELRQKEARAPRTREELKQRDQKIQEQFRVLRSEIDGVAFEIAGLEETLGGIAEYVRRESDRLTAEERAQVEEIRKELRDEIKELENDRRTLSRYLEETRRAFGARDESLVRHRELREEIQQLQNERAEIVDAMAGQLSAQQRANTIEVAEARRKMPRLKKRLDRYFNQLDTIVAERMEEIQLVLESEKAQLATYQAELDDWTGDTETTVAELAMLHFLEIDHEFNLLVRRGHVGLVDVDWQQLDDATREREQLMDKKMETENMLREAFPDLR